MVDGLTVVVRGFENRYASREWGEENGASELSSKAAGGAGSTAAILDASVAVVDWIRTETELDKTVT